MLFIKKNYVNQIIGKRYLRAGNFQDVQYTKIDLFNNAKKILLASNVSKETWYLLIDKINQSSICSKKEFISTSKPINLIDIVHQLFLENGEFVNVEDIRRILYAYEDYCTKHLELVVDEHFAIQNFAQDLYRLKTNQVLCEILLLSDFIILKMCPSELMEAQILTIEIAIKLAKKDSDFECGLAFADYGLSTLNVKSCTHKYCENSFKRFQGLVREDML